MEEKHFPATLVEILKASEIVSRDYLAELSKPFWDALEKESDRSVGIIAVSVLDNLLERLIRASYIKDLGVKILFKDDHFLQSLSAKINIAYFSGLIPRFVYHDLKLICEIRNKFAHAVAANLSFTDLIISQRINKCELRPKTLDTVYAPKTKFLIIVQLIVGLLGFWEQFLLKARIPNLVELLKLNDFPYDELPLTKEEIIEVIKKEISKNLPKDK
jgi:DNA-binding MltR family transcriptional regulator